MKHFLSYGGMVTLNNYYIPRDFSGRGGKPRVMVWPKARDIDRIVAAIKANGTKTGMGHHVCPEIHLKNVLNIQIFVLFAGVWLPGHCSFIQWSEENESSQKEGSCCRHTGTIRVFKFPRDAFSPVPLAGV